MWQGQNVDQDSTVPEARYVIEQGVSTLLGLRLILQSYLVEAVGKV